MTTSKSQNEPPVEQQSLDLGLATVPHGKKNEINEDLILTPRAITGSALFTTRNPKTKREYAKRKEIDIAPGIGSLKYTGEELRYSDFEIWQCLIELARTNEIHKKSYVLHTHIRQVLKLIDKDTGGKAYEAFRDCLDRLKATSLSFESLSGTIIRSFSLLQKYEIFENSLTVYLDPEIYRFFQPSELILLNAADLRHMPVLTRKVYGIIRSTKDNLTVEQFMKIAGHDYKRVTQFKPKLIAALKQLHVGGHISDWHIAKVNKEYVVFVELDGQVPLMLSEPTPT